MLGAGRTQGGGHDGTDVGSIQRILATEAGDLTDTEGLASERPVRLSVTPTAPTPTRTPTGPAQTPTSRRHADHQITDRPVRRNSTCCKASLDLLCFTGTDSVLLHNSLHGVSRCMVQPRCGSPDAGIV
jgi:hypothetical protein